MQRLTPLLACALLAACGGGTENESTSSLITAAEGGSLALEGTETKVTFPAGAVGEDVEISLDIGNLADYPEQEGALAKILVLGPTMNLESPATLNIDLEGQVEPNDVVRIVQFTDGVWIRPEVGTVEIGSGGVGSTSLYLIAPTAVVVEPIPVDAGSIEGSVFHIYTEEPLAGIEFKVIVNGASAGSATSNSDGRFVFDNVPAGSVSVEALVDSAQNCYNDPTSKDVDVSTDEAAEVYFGFVPGPC